MELGIQTLSPDGYDPTVDPSPINLDLCFVHGLNGNSVNTWTSKAASKVETDCFWPQEILAPLLPTARIMTFGYNANVLSEGVDGRIAEFAENLIAELMADRAHQSEEGRPIIFVCHSMGGIVVKRALSVAKSRQVHNPIVDCTKSIIFLATPHRGSDHAQWASIVGRMLRSASIFGISSTMATHELNTFSTVLEDINHDFVNISSQFKIISFFEKKPTKGIGVIVEKHSAIMEILSEECRIAVPATHKDICRFSHKDSHEFQTFFKQLRRLVALATQSPRPGTSELPDSLTPMKRILADDNDNVSSSSTQKRHQLSNETGEMSVPHPLGLWRVPHFSPGDYFNRESALLKLREALTGPTERSSGIHGLGGVGKTRLARKYIETYSNDYPYIFWVVADSVLKLDAAYRDMAIDIGMIDESVTDPVKCRQAMKGWFIKTPNWLLILDNVDEPTILRDYLPSLVNGSIITTSRSAPVEGAIVANAVRLETLSILEGAEFLMSKIPKDIRDNYRGQQVFAEEISKELGGQPLALAVYARYIALLQLPLREFLEDYRQDKAKFMSSSLQEQLREASFDYELSLSTCFSIPMQTLHGKPSHELLGILSMLDPDSITENLLINYATTTQKSDIPVLSDRLSYRHALIELLKYGWIEKSSLDVSSDDKQPSISIHRLVQDSWVLSMANRDFSWKSFDYAVSCLSRSYPRQINGESMAEVFHECRPLTSHVISLKSRYVLLTSLRPGADLRPTQAESFVQLLADAGWFLYETGHWGTGKELLKIAEGICHDLFGTPPHQVPHQLTALIYNNLGVIYDSQNNWEKSLLYAMKSLNIREKCLPQDDPEMGNSYSNFGHAKIDCGKIEEAQKYYKRAIEVHESAKVPSSDLLEGAYSCMGKSMLYLDRLAEAEHWITKAIEEHKKFKSDNFFVAETLFAFGSLRMKQGRWNDAETIIQKSLDIRVDVLGPDARLVGVCLHHLAFISDHNGDLDLAIQRLQRAVLIFQVESQTQPGLLERSLSKLAAVMERREDEESIKNAATIRQEIRQISRKMPSCCDINPEDEKGWNSIVQVCYRCV